MSLCGLCDPSDPQRKKSNELTKEIKKWHEEYDKAIKILLLGAGESGKTTIIKQAKILHINGFSDSERKEKALEMRRNILQALLELISIMPKLNPPAVIEKPDNEKAVDFFRKLNIKPYTDDIESCTDDIESYTDFTEEFYDYADSLWNDSGIKDCLTRGHEFPLIDSAKYLFGMLTDIKNPNFIPSDQDILQSRKRTTDIQKIEFSVKIPIQYGGGSQMFWMYDVGGQRGERKKWIQVFDGINAILFLTACNSFDTHLREDVEVNTLRESLEVFDQVWNSRFLRDAGIILFLNKQDLLREKISSGVSIRTYFNDYDDYKLNLKDGNPNNEYEKTRAFIRDKFLAVTLKRSESRNSIWSVSDTLGSRNNERKCYPHYTIATDTRNVKRVFDDVHTMLVTTNLKFIGLI